MLFALGWDHALPRLDGENRSPRCWVQASRIIPIAPPKRVPRRDRRVQGYSGGQDAIPRRRAGILPFPVRDQRLLNLDGRISIRANQQIGLIHNSCRSTSAIVEISRGASWWRSDGRTSPIGRPGASPSGLRPSTSFRQFLPISSSWP
ncbi:predicted protein [Uncinocarpus reesii 1704]|uniref:Uncharacterized protein n=1 Tax=Uncinocarpus reesii (strain UAMH 1704) TaxID=336963 RepID=C4JNX4_UNCRE|nr:uncharacterized protein UREG_04444 [Uncinocarpus reesii 1704]EEP79598.1 predicted protein [Uncinocarpus reesii 1704]